MTHKIYRVEHGEILVTDSKVIGLGPYHRKGVRPDWYSDMRNKHNHGEEHPCIWEDLILQKLSGNNRHNYFCGFNSIADAKSWFDGYLSHLLNDGFHLVEYELSENPINGISGKQIMFNQEHVVSKQPILTK